MRHALAIIVALSMLAPSITRADDHDPVLAEALFREGRKAADAGDLPTACAKFAESQRLDPTPGTLLNLGDCEERTNKLANAWQHFNQLYDTLAPTDDRRPLARSRADAVAARLPKLRIVLAPGSPPNTRVERDGLVMSDATLSIAVPVNPGPHTIIVHAPHHVDATSNVTLVEGQQREVIVSVGPLAPKVVEAPVPVAPPPVVAPIAPVMAPSKGRRMIGIVVGSAGVVLAGVGAGFGFAALSNEHTSEATCLGNVCTDQHGIDLHERAKSQAMVSDALIATGIVALGVGVVLYLTAPKVRVTPSASRLVLGGSF
jgi:hypothetical protein